MTDSRIEKLLDMLGFINIESGVYKGREIIAAKDSCEMNPQVFHIDPEDENADLQVAKEVVRSRFNLWAIFENLKWKGINE